MKSFIDAYLEYTSDLETPTSFFKWGSYATVSAVMRDNIFLDQNQRVLYPNIYVLLVADSGISRKSSPIITSVDLLQELRVTKVIRGRSSIQAILQELAEGKMDPKTGILLTGGSAILCADELASFIVSDPATIPILTDLYDFKEQFDQNLKGGKFVIKKTCVTMLAASNETHLREVYSSLAVFGGLVARTFFIRPDEVRKPNPLFSTNITSATKNINTARRTNLLAQLKDIGKLKGSMKPDPDAEEEYAAWYKLLYDKYGKKEDKSGVLSRIHTGVIKLSMILAVAHNCDMVIRKRDVEEAISECIKLLPNYEVYVMSSGKADIATAGTLLLTTLYEASEHQVSKKVFLNHHWTEIEDEILNRTVDTLMGAGMLEVYMNDGAVFYKLTEQGLNRMKGKLEEPK